MSSNNTKLTARERARQARADQQAREAAALNDVETFFKSTEALEEIQGSYDKDVAALEERYAAKRKPLEDKAALAVAGLNSRGDNKPSIAAQLGITVPEVSGWIERSALAAATTIAPAAPKGAGKKADRTESAGNGSVSLAPAGGEASGSDASAPAGASGEEHSDESDLEQRASA